MAYSHVDWGTQHPHPRHPFPPDHYHYDPNPSGQMLHYPLAPPTSYPYYYYPHPEDCYGMAQHVPAPGYGVPPPPPAYPPPQHRTWHSDGPPVGRQMGHYKPPFVSQASDREARRPRRRSSKRDKDWTALEVVPSRELATALAFVRQCSQATLFDIDGVIPAVASADAGASRFVHVRLRVGSSEERHLGLTAALSSIDDLTCHQYGNYLLQGLFEFGSDETKEELLEALCARDVVALCLHQHGCRVIQKALLHLGPVDVRRLFAVFRDKVHAFSHDINGNHVIVSCIRGMTSCIESAVESGDPEAASDPLQLIVDTVIASVEKTSTDRYGCRIVQHAIEHCVGTQQDAVLDGIMSCHERLVVNQYGNYVVQQVLVHGGRNHQAQILETLTADGALLSLSQHKYASNVVEAVLVHGESHHKEELLEEMLKDTRGDPGGYCCLIELAKDPIANYVVNKAIEVSESDQGDRILELIFSSRQELSYSPYAKYVLQRATDAVSQ